MLEIFFVQLVAAALGTVSIGVADLLYKAGRIGQGFHTFWVSCSTAAICVPVLTWTTDVFLGPTMASRGLVGAVAAAMFYWSYRNLRKLPADQQSAGGFLDTRSASRPLSPSRRTLATLTGVENSQERDQ